MSLQDYSLEGVASIYKTIQLRMHRNSALKVTRNTMAKLDSTTIAGSDCRRRTLVLVRYRRVVVDVARALGFDDRVSNRW